MLLVILVAGVGRVVVVVVVVEMKEVKMVVEGPVPCEWRWWFSEVFWILVFLALT